MCILHLGIRLIPGPHGGVLLRTGVAALVASLAPHELEPQPPQGLHELLLHGCGVDASGVQALAGSRLPQSLVHLSLAHNPELGVEAAEHLGAIVVSAPRLQSLMLQGTSIGDRGAAAVVSAAAAAAGQQGQGLRELDLSNTGCGKMLG